MSPTGKIATYLLYLAAAYASEATALQAITFALFGMLLTSIALSLEARS